MSEASSYVNLQTTWSNDRYYEVGLISYILGLTTNTYLFITIKKVGIAFLGPFVIFNIIFGIPMTILELSLSQYGKKGMIDIWDLCPIFKGMGYLCLLYLFIELVEDLSILAFLARYLVSSFSTTIGWDSCDNSWNTEYCYTLETNVSRRLDCYDLHGKAKCDQVKWDSSHNQYWQQVVQNIDIGMFQWKSVAYSLGVALIGFALTFKGIRLMEKIVYWALIFSAIQFIIILYCSFIQHGSGNGLVNLFHWNVAVFKNKRDWALTFQLMLNSSALGSGGLRTLGAQNRFRGHSYMNAMMLVLVNITVTVLYCVLYFSLCGNLSYASNQDIYEIFKDPEVELFSKVPRMIQRLDGPKRLWQWMFFMKVFLILFSKCLMITFVIVKTIFERFPKMENYFMLTCCSVYFAAFLCCIPTFTKYGIFVLKQVLWMTVRGPTIFLMNFLQVVAILYIYGLTTVVDDLHFMLGFRLSFYWQIILLLTPIFQCAMWIVTLLTFYEFERYRSLPGTERFFLNVLAYLPILMTIGYAIYYIRWMIWKCKWENFLRPNDGWYLSDPILRKSRQMFSAMSMTKEYLYRQTKKQEKAVYEYDETAYEEEAA